jgi:hypothetical protein
LLDETNLPLLRLLVVDHSRVNWEFVWDLFADYELWRSSPGLFASTVVPFVRESFDSQTPARFLHFFFDCLMQFQLTAPGLLQLIGKLARKDAGSFIIHLLNKSPPPTVQALLDNLLSLVPLRFLGQLPEAYFLKGLRDYAATCTTIDAAGLESLIPWFEQMVIRPELWLALFYLGTGVWCSDLAICRRNRIVRPVLIPILFQLVCALYQYDSFESMFLQVVGVVAEICVDVNLTPFVDSIRQLLHFGAVSNDFVFVPNDFGDELGPGRMPVEGTDVSETKKPTVVCHPGYGMKAEEFLGSGSLFFGFQSPTIAQDLNQMIELRTEQAAWTPLRPNSESDPTASVAHRFVIQIATQCLQQMGKQDLEKALHSLTVFGANVNPVVFKSIHQVLMLSFIQVTLPEAETLRFLHSMVLVGWWDGKLPELFNSLCPDFERVRPEDTERWAAFCNVIQAILLLCPGFAQLRMSLAARVLFHESALADKDYFLFIPNILLSESFVEARAAEVRETWNHFLSHVRPTHLEHLTESPGRIDARSSLEDLVIASGFFESTNGQWRDFYDNLVRRSQTTVRDYVTTHQPTISQIKAKIRQIRTHNIVNRHVYQQVSSQARLNSCLREIEAYTWRLRFNLLWLRDERDALKLWQMLPVPVRTCFEVANSAHPLSVPSLLVPSIRPGGRQMPFFPGFRGLILQQLLAFCYPSSGLQLEMIPVSMCWGTTFVPSVLIVYELGCLILNGASLEHDELFLLESDYVSVYSLFFFGHSLLKFNFGDLLHASGRKCLACGFGLELWFVQGYSLFFVFSDLSVGRTFARKCESFLRVPVMKISPHSPLFVTSETLLESYTEMWTKQKLSSWHYLLLLNYFASRSFAYLPQYPIMPLVHGRDLSKPIPGSHATYYSTPSIVNSFLFLLEPHSSFGGTTELVLENKEFVPELFICPEFFSNVSQMRQPREAAVPESFFSFSHWVIAMKAELNQSEKIHDWIDLIFGVKSRGEAAEALGNVFPPECCGGVLVSPEALFANGIVPRQLFEEPHPKRDSLGRPPIKSLWKVVCHLSQPLIHFDLPKDDFEVRIRDHSIELVLVRDTFAKRCRDSRSAFDCCAFAPDELFFCGMIGIGTVWVYNTILVSKEPFLVKLGSCLLPARLCQNVELPFTCCAVSSSLNMVVIASAEKIFTFHIASLRFIRIVECGFRVASVLIGDADHLMVAIGAEDIAVFTVNGTPIASVLGLQKITSGCIGSESIITAWVGGGISFWTIDFEHSSLVERKTIEFGPVAAMAEFDRGAALFAMDEKGTANVFAAPRARKYLVKRVQVGGCGECGRQGRYHVCKLCGLSYCGNCLVKQAEIICQRCLSSVGQTANLK